MRLHETIAHRLEKAILRGEIRSGSRFPPEREMAQRYGVSRSTIREAVGKLAQLGLVQTLPQSGTYVTDYITEGSLDLLLHIMRHSETLDADVVFSLMEFRKLGELFAVRKAVRGAGEEDVRRIVAVVEKESASEEIDRDILACDYDLHFTLIALAENLVLQLLFNSFKPVYRFYADFFFRLPGAVQTTVSQHRRFVRAFSRRDEEGAVRVMDEALDYGERRVIEALGIGDRRREIPWVGPDRRADAAGE